MKKNKAYQCVYAFSLIEILIVISLFAFLGVITTRALVDSLKNTRKSENIIGIRAQLENSINVMERNLRNKSDLTCLNSGAWRIIQYTDPDITDLSANQGAYACIVSTSYYTGLYHHSDVQPWPAIAQWENLIQGEGYGGKNVSLECTFTCNTPTDPKVPESVTISITATDTAATGEEGASITINTNVGLRTY